MREHHRRRQRLIQCKNINRRDPSASLKKTWNQAPHFKRLTNERLVHSTLNAEALQNRGPSKTGAFTLAAALVRPAQRLLPMLAPVESISSVPEAA